MKDTISVSNQISELYHVPVIRFLSLGFFISTPISCIFSDIVRSLLEIFWSQVLSQYFPWCQSIEEFEIFCAINILQLTVLINRGSTKTTLFIY
jgi:hypothetical protein